MALLSSLWRTPAHVPAATRDNPNRHLLLLRFALINTVATGLAGAVYLQGWLDAAFRDFTFWLSAVILSVFAFGLGLCSARVWHTSVALAELGVGRPGVHSREYLRRLEPAADTTPLLTANLLRLRLNARIAIVLHTANALVFLGLVGTVIGFIVALSGVDPMRAGAADNVAPMVATLVHGMSIALYTTLLGALLHLWLVVNYRLLAAGTLQLFTAVIEVWQRRVDG